MSNITPENQGENWFTPPIPDRPVITSQAAGTAGATAFADAITKAIKRPYSGGPIDVRIIDIDRSTLNKLEATLATQLKNIKNITAAGIAPSTEVLKNAKKTADTIDQTYQQSKKHARELIGLEDMRGARAYKVQQTLNDSTTNIIKRMTEVGMRGTTLASGSGMLVSGTPIAYRYLTDKGQETAEIPAQAGRQAIEAYRRAMGQGKTTNQLSEQEITGQRIITDYTARQLSNEEKKNKERMQSIKYIREEVTANKEIERVTKEAAKILGGSPGNAIRQLQTRGILKNQMIRGIPVEFGGQIIAQDLSQDQIRVLLERARSGVNLSDKEKAQLQGLTTSVQEDLRAGRGQRSTFNVKEFAGALMSGNFGGAFKEGMQALPFAGGLAERLQARGTTLSEAGLARGGGIGALQRLGGFGIGGLATGLSPVGLFAAYEIAQRGLGQYRQGLGIGQITGQGFEAGQTARLAAFGQGINPFDILSGRTALEIQTGARQQGFQGGLADRISVALGDLVNKGIGDWQTNLVALSQAIREGGQTIGGFSRTMQDLRNVARDTQTSVADLTKAYIAYQDTIVKGGGSAQGAGEKFAALQSVLGGLGKPFQGSAAAAVGGQWLTHLGPQIAAMAGVPIWRVPSLSPAAQGRAIDRVIEVAIAPYQNRGMTINSMAQMIAFVDAAIPSSIFYGLDAPQISAILRAYKNGAFEHASRQEVIKSSVAANKGGGSFFGHVWGDITGQRHQGLAHDIGSAVGHLTSGGNSTTYEERQINTLLGGLQRAGVTQAEITAIRNTLESSRQSSDKNRKGFGGFMNRDLLAPNEFQRTLNAIEKQVQTKKFIIEFGPQAKKFFKVTNPSYQAAVEGRGSMQGTQPNPGG